ncbi:hypothetical protein ACFQDD_00615 [Halorubrum pallidum]|uniref:Uncharacterized protein n=1 Tax=Halorubrum pallidum TaxID=1526114 RepID=A0ABD5SXU6_9EURY
MSKDTDRGSGGTIQLSIEDHHEGFLNDNPELNASALFRSKLDDTIEQTGWEPDSDKAIDSSGESVDAGENQSGAATPDGTTDDLKQSNSANETEAETDLGTDEGGATTG